MAIPVWDPVLPPLTNMPGATQGPPSGVARSTIDGALPDARLTHKDDPRAFDERLVMDPTQMAAFDTFFHDTLAMGALSFTHVNSWTGAAARLKISGQPSYTVSGSELATIVSLRFLEVAT